MTLFIFSIIFLTIIAILFAILPWIKQKKIAASSVLTILLVMVSVGLYSLWGNFTETTTWLETGKDRYELRKKFYHLGSVKDIVIHMRQYMEKNPQDTNGWYLLGKLALNDQQMELAQYAFQQAHALDKDNAKVNAMLAAVSDKVRDPA